MEVPPSFWQFNGSIPTSRQVSQKAGVQNNVVNARPRRNKEEQGLLFLTLFLFLSFFFSFRGSKCFSAKGRQAERYWRG